MRLTSVPPLLAASASLALLGLSWAALELCKNHPWLLLIGASAACLLAHCCLLARAGGVRSLLPPWLLDALHRPAFELVRSAGVVLVLNGVNFLRVVLLAMADLSEDQQAQVLAELSTDYKRKCFKRPCIELLPGFLQQLITGQQTVQKGVVRGDSGNDSPTLLPPQRSSSRTSLRKDSGASDFSAPTKVEEMLEQIRGLEGAVKGVETQKLQKVLNEKMTDIALGSLPQTTSIALGTLHKSTVKAVKDAKEHIAPLLTPRAKTTLNVATTAWSRASPLACQAIDSLFLPWRLTVASTKASWQAAQMIALAAFMKAQETLHLEFLNDYLPASMTKVQRINEGQIAEELPATAKEQKPAAGKEGHASRRRAANKGKAASD